MHVEDNFTILLPLIWLVYFISSCIPTFSMADFLVKGSVALYLFATIHISEDIILTTTFIMYMLNFAMPAVVGAIFVFRYKTENQLDYDMG